MTQDVINQQIVWVLPAARERYASKYADTDRSFRAIISAYPQFRTHCAHITHYAATSVYDVVDK